MTIGTTVGVTKAVPKTITATDSTTATPNATETASAKEPARPINFHFRATEEEAAAIRGRMAEMGVVSLGAYLRKMSIDGYHVYLDLTDVREMVTLLRRVGLNVNQVAKRCNETRSIYAADVAELQRSYDEIWEAVRKILEVLGKIK